MEHVVYFDPSMVSCQRINSPGDTSTGKLSVRPKEIAAAITPNWYAVSQNGGAPIYNPDYVK